MDQGGRTNQAPSLLDATTTRKTHYSLASRRITLVATHLAAFFSVTHASARLTASARLESRSSCVSASSWSSQLSPTRSVCSSGPTEAASFSTSKSNNNGWESHAVGSGGNRYAFCKTGQMRFVRIAGTCDEMSAARGWKVAGRWRDAMREVTAKGGGGKFEGERKRASEAYELRRSA